MIVYIVSLVLMTVHKQNVINSCRVVGFVGIQNAQREITPVRFSSTNNDYYSPVKYPGIMTEYATSQEDCEHIMKTFSILFGVIIFVVQLLQVQIVYVLHICSFTNFFFDNRFTLRM
jgi:hypothetical protein